MKNYKSFEQIGQPGEELILKLGELPKSLMRRGGVIVSSLAFTHGVVSAEEMAFHAKDVLSEENWQRLSANEAVEQAFQGTQKRYRIRAVLYPTMAFYFTPIHNSLSI